MRTKVLYWNSTAFCLIIKFFASYILQAFPKCFQANFPVLLHFIPWRYSHGGILCSHAIGGSLTANRLLGYHSHFLQYSNWNAQHLSIYPIILLIWPISDVGHDGDVRRAVLAAQPHGHRHRPLLRHHQGHRVQGRQYPIKPGVLIRNDSPSSEMERAIFGSYIIYSRNYGTRLFTRGCTMETHEFALF